MKSTGIVRKVDELGRIVLPVELRRTMDIAEKDPLEIYVDGNSIVLRKYRPAASSATAPRMCGPSGERTSVPAACGSSGSGHKHHITQTAGPGACRFARPGGHTGLQCRRLRGLRPAARRGILYKKCRF